MEGSDDIGVELRHEQGGDPLDEELVAAEGEDAAEERRLLGPDGGLPRDEGDVEVVWRGALGLGPQVPGLLLHRPRPNLQGYPGLRVLLCGCVDK